MIAARHPDPRPSPSRRLAGIALVAALALALPAAATQVVKVRAGSHPEFTRVVFELDGPAGYSIEEVGTAQAPMLRVTVEAGTAFHRLRTTGDVRSVKVTEGDRAEATIALAKQGLRVREMILSNPYRIVLDLYRPETSLAKRAAPAKPVAEKKPAPKPIAKVEPKPAPAPIARVEPAPAPKPEPAAKPEPIRTIAKPLVPKPDPAPPAIAKPEPAPAPAPAIAKADPAPAIEKPAPAPAIEKPAPAPAIAKPAPAPAIAKPAPAEPPAPVMPADPMPEAIAKARPAPPKPKLNPVKPKLNPVKPAPAETAKTAASGAGWMDRITGDPLWQGGLAAGVLGIAAIAFIAIRRHRALPNDLDVTAITEEVESAAPAPAGGFAMDEAPAAESADADASFADLFSEDAAPAAAPTVEQPAAAVPASEPASAPAPAAGETDSLFDDTGTMVGDDSTEGDAPMNQDMDLPVDSAVSPSPVMGGAAAPSADMMQMLQDMERRMQTLEGKLDEANEAREKLERQVAAQSEELRVQRAAIARTQRALRTMSRADEDKATEPALREGDTQAKTRVNV